ncbi:MAG: MBL fold metallo-hydrolase [Lentisphaeria bacterium]|nr:MBL fold metallo-hydrolase [Lentisphaeria bacterium]
MKLTILTENNAVPPFEAEHGLSMLLEQGEYQLLFDTGAGEVFAGNCSLMKKDFSDLNGIILSHGHMDHTGGLHILSPCTVWHAPGITQHHFSHHPGKPVRTLTMPERCIQRLQQCRCREISSFTEILPGIFLTGPIPRISGEDCGGPFFSDNEGMVKDDLSDEQALLTKDGILIQGCCHAGVINTLEYCRKEHPEITVHTVIGGLHLLLASEDRLKQTADYLRGSGIRTLYLLHCTGEHAIDFLRKQLPGIKIFTPGVDGSAILL